MKKIWRMFDKETTTTSTYTFDKVVTTKMSGGRISDIGAANNAQQQQLQQELQQMGLSESEISTILGSQDISLDSQAVHQNSQTQNQVHIKEFDCPSCTHKIKGKPQCMYCGYNMSEQDIISLSENSNSTSSTHAANSVDKQFIEQKTASQLQKQKTKSKQNTEVDDSFYNRLKGM